MTIPDPGSDPVPDEGGVSSFGFLGSLIGLDRFEHRLFNRLETLMARLDPIDAALGNAATALTDLGAQTAQIATQLGDLTAGSVTQAEIDAIAAKAQAVADGIAAAAANVDALIEPDAGEGEPPVEPPVEPVP